MEVTYTHCAGMDVHKKTVVVCCITPGSQGEKEIETRTFGTMTQDLLALSDWLTSKGITHVAMESTGELWKPVYNILEANFTVLVVNAKHIKNVPGRKTDVRDAQWIAALLRHGLVRGSFIPPLPQRDLRDLTRQGTSLVQERARVTNRLHKVLEWANIKLTSVATDVNGVSARSILEAIVSGQGDPQVLAGLAKGRMRHKQPELERALTGLVRDHHRFLIANHLVHLDFLDEQMAVFEAKIAEFIQAQTTSEEPPAPDSSSSVGQAAAAERPLSWEEAVELLDTIPGIGRVAAEILVAEIGTDMRRFPSEEHLASWAKVCPGNNESAGKHHSGKTGHGNASLIRCLVQAAHAASRTRGCYLAALYRRLVKRLGVQKAIVALAHRILVIAYHILLKREPYRELGVNYLDERRKEHVVNRMRSRIEQLGYKVTLEPVAVTAS
jgi:transposase